ncbi:hypothetical protein Q6348_11690 [Isoptericola sp. b441]|uniref:DUF2231 domain-containing protein n=1 Tax=Actinotalea lenta TaxID=3064654 RepID=A0ABT9DAC3_9CELL|nr:MULTISPECIES: DUF2231 domain-containing protein [unclassified Isoptericola]MDO8107857.1 hypothetical protein [Isoptericola sp. b441]MDO8120473.1 hypothetical protein [Isoptericola sp. b490]
MTIAHDRPLAVRLIRRLEEDERLERLASALGPLADLVSSPPSRRSMLLGAPTGHAAHPFLTDLPLGAWTSASILDLVGGRQARPAARTLIGVGVLAAVPASVTGLAEWTHTDPASGRVGALHAAGNTVALALFGASWLARGHGHHRRGVVLALAGGGLAAAAGFLGGHLAAARNVTSRDEEFASSLPADADQELRGSMLT